MGAFTPLAKVWYPDANDTAKPDTLLATLASSIENGLQPRLALQEKAVGIKAGISAAQAITTTMTTMPYQVGSGAGQFNNGFGISTSGVVTVQTPGMYFVSAALSITNVAGMSVKINVFQNSNAIIFDEMASSASYYQLAKGSTVLNCVAGDTLYVQGGNSGGSSTTVANATLNHFTVVLIRPTPLVS